MGVGAAIASGNHNPNGICALLVISLINRIIIKNILILKLFILVFIFNKILQKIITNESPNRLKKNVIILEIHLSLFE
jgi:hypothetical protein